MARLRQKRIERETIGGKVPGVARQQLAPKDEAVGDFNNMPWLGGRLEVMAELQLGAHIAKLVALQKRIAGQILRRRLGVDDDGSLLLQGSEFAFEPGAVPFADAIERDAERIRIEILPDDVL